MVGLEMLTDFMERNDYTILKDGELFRSLVELSAFLEKRSADAIELMNEFPSHTEEGMRLGREAEVVAAQFLAHQEVIHLMLSVLEMSTQFEVVVPGHGNSPPN